jgi:hypothetical protein
MHVTTNIARTFALRTALTRGVEMKQVISRSEVLTAVWIPSFDWRNCSIRRKTSVMVATISCEILPGASRVQTTNNTFSAEYFSVEETYFISINS